MKKYSTNAIKKYIEEHRRDIDYVDCGMREDWSWTAEIVFENDKFSENYDWDNDNISVAGISGSTWATPVMNVHFKDGNAEIVDCYIDDMDRVDKSQIIQQKMFAQMTGRMDSI